MSTDLSLRQRTKSALDRIMALETDVPKIVAAVNNGFANFEQRLNELTEIINALSQEVGEQTVSARVASNRIARAEALANAQKEGLAKALTDGRVVAAETIGEKTVIVGKETDKDGNIIPPGRIQMEFRQIVPAFKEKFEGQKVGTKVETPNGGSIEVTELYDIVDPPPQAANADQVATDADAPAASEGSASSSAAAVASDASPTQPSAEA